MSSSAKVLVDTTDDYKRANILDIEDVTATDTLEEIADPSLHACTSANFADDSWIPSINQNPVYVTCAISDGKQTSVDQCPSGVTTSDLDCNGCMDTYGLFESKTTNA